MPIGGWMLSIFLSVLLGLAGPLASAVQAEAAPEVARSGIETNLVEALRAMDKGEHQAAAAIYENIIAHGLNNGSVFYNLGICYEALGRKGDAMAAFLAAKRLKPRDPDISANLKAAIAKIPDKLDAEREPHPALRLAFWLFRFNQRELAYGGAWLLGLLGVGMILSQAYQRWQRMQTYIWVLLPVALLMLGSAWVRGLLAPPWGAVNTAAAKVLAGPGASNAPLFELREGAPFMVTDMSESEYLQIALSDGKKGWIARAQVKVFGL